MALTVFEVIENANYNLQHNGAFGAEIAKVQLQNALKAIENGQGIYDEFKEGDE